MPNFERLAKAGSDGAKAAFASSACSLRGEDQGPNLLSWTHETTSVAEDTLAQPKPQAKSQHSMLPVLVVLFLISYGLMSLLVVEQDRTISSQRSLITSLFGDSTELSALKGKIFQKQHASAQAQAEANNRSQAQAPSSRIPSTQAPLTQDTPGNAASNRNAGKLRKALPQRPPAAVTDIGDVRRIVKAI